MKIAIVILNWNGVSLLKQFLPKVIQYSQDAQVYVVDNASTDGSVVFLKKYFPQIKIIENSENGGYAKGYNQALSQIEADVYCLLNSDVEVTENWLNPIVECFSKNNEIAIVQPKILDHKNKSRFEYAGAAGGFLDKYGFPFCRGRIFDTIEMDLGQYDNNIDLFWASGACFFIRSEVFRKIQGFDEDFFAHQEEIDLCWRVHHLKKRIIYCSDAVVYHVGGATLSVGNPKKGIFEFS
ncbi:Glycosyltransferase (fragment) [Capnocytophaga canimorsus]|uniref:Glycosyltransferase n=1 Tax=Capnocytophaga canimorsus TaxID=28188 RepID=A0A0B7H5Y6_9FLAO